MTTKPGHIHPAALAFARHIWPLVWLAHRPTLSGVAHLPPPGQPYLLIANHSAGFGLSEIVCLAALYAREIGPTRPLAGFSHHIIFKIWPLSPMLRAFGAVPSTYEAAHDTLSQGVPLLIFPGGDHETLRPIWEADKVDLAGRLGFLRIARAHHAPIIPLRIHNSHWAAPILFRANPLARLLIIPRYLFGIKRWSISLLALLGVAALIAAPLSWPMTALLIYLWLGCPLNMITIFPVTLRYHIGAPITPESLFPDGEQGGDAQLRDALAAVQARLQAL